MKNEETKVGARNSRKDQERLQMMHDYSVENGAICDDTGKAIDLDELLVTLGNEIKVLKDEDGRVEVGGYLITFSTADEPDLTGDFFDEDTDYATEFPTKSLTWFNHRQPVEIKEGSKKRRLYIAKQFESAELTKDEIGIFFRGILDERDEYEKMLIELARMGKLGLSSGTAPHLAKRTPTNKGANHIDMWALGLDASYTHRPAEFRNAVVPIKSLLSPETASADKGEDEKKETETAVPSAKEKQMERDEFKALLDEQKTSMVDLVKTEAQTAAKDAVKEVIESLPEIKAAMNLQVTEAEEDKPFKSLAENMLAIRAATIKGYEADNLYPRLRYLKATGASEGVPQDGGILLDPTLASEILKPIHDTGPFSQDIRWLPVGGNSNYGWINGVDETSRVTGSRWGGIRGYRLAEGGSKTASKPTFRRINWELKKYAAVVVATDELLADAAQFSEIVRTGVSEELTFMLNEDIFDGVGLAGPQGIQNSGAMITVTRTDANNILGTDISNMWTRLDLRGRARSKWYISNDSQPQLDKLFAVGSTAVLFPYAGYTPQGVRTLYGRPVAVTEFNETLGTAGDIVLADMSQYLGWEKGSIEESTSIHVYYLTDETAFRFVYRCDGKSSVNTALTPLKGSTTTSPYVRLLATS